jgi:hypothetical protein
MTPRTRSRTMAAGVFFGVGLISMVAAFAVPVFSKCVRLIHAQPDYSDTVTCKAFAVLSIGGEIGMFIGVIFAVLALWSLLAPGDHSKK